MWGEIQIVLIRDFRLLSLSKTGYFEWQLSLLRNAPVIDIRVILFQLTQDNSRAHTAVISTWYLADKNIAVLPWPSLSHNLAPIEHARPRQTTNARELEAGSCPSGRVAKHSTDYDPEEYMYQLYASQMYCLRICKRWPHTSFIINYFCRFVE